MKIKGLNTLAEKVASLSMCEINYIFDTIESKKSVIIELKLKKTL